MLGQGVYFFLQKFTVFNRGFKVPITSNASYTGLRYNSCSLNWRQKQMSKHQI